MAEAESYPMKARVWKRKSTQEWVLEIEGTINGVNMTCRHTQPLALAPENVPELPSRYAEPSWHECLQISEDPEVDEALRGFAEGETTEDQAVCIVQAVIKAFLNR